MGGRWFHIAVVISWLLSMSWLFVEKLAPTFRGGVQPVFDAYGTESDPSPEPVGWRLKWDDEEIGWAMIRSARRPDDTVVVRSVVQFEDLPVDRLILQLLGTIGPMVRQSIIGQEDLRLDFSVVTNTEFAADGEVRRFQSSIHSGAVRDLMRVEGTVDGSRMEVVVYGRTSPGHKAEGPREIYRQKVELPSRAMIGDSFSLQSRLANLRVGQRWTFPVYRPFPPGSQPEIIEAHVARNSSMHYEGGNVPVLQVVFRRGAGSGISAAQEPTGCMWVDHDGTVLQQEVRLVNVSLRFRRTPGSSYDEEVQQIDPGWNDVTAEAPED